MKFFALAALVATTQAAAGTAKSVADGAECTGDTDCTTATSSCCQSYADATAQSNKTVGASKKYCSAKVATN